MLHFQSARKGCCRLEEDLSFPNTVEDRFSLNWIKLRAWQWEEYDALVILDVDVLVRGDLTHLFHLPTHFAWTRNNGGDGWDFNKVRVCMCGSTLLCTDGSHHVNSRMLPC